MEEGRPLIILTGPTAVGKTKLSILLAKTVGGEIISADSMQVYRHMDIGSAKIKPGQMDGVPHFMIDLLEPWEPFNITVFQSLSKKYMEEIYGRGHIPILTGGTGFYIQSVLYDIDFTKNREDGQYRAYLDDLKVQKGEAFLYGMLQDTDPESAKQIHENNVKRVIRALEFYHLTGEKISEHNRRERSRQPAFRSCYFVLNDNRKTIYQNIDRRVDLMLSEGLVDEVQKLRLMGCRRDMVSMQGLGYKEILDYLDGKSTLEEAVYRIKRDTRHFAKRQLTWFRREKDVIWVDKSVLGQEDTALLTFMDKKLQEKGIL